MEISVFKGDKIEEIRKITSKFLYEHLDEFGDPLEDILACLDYAKNRGGKAFVAKENEEVVGAVVTNETGMKGYIPENMLVYIAVDSKMRGRGVGKKLMEKTIEETEGDIALHVEDDNPARFLYEKVGFTNPYIEMRYKRK